MSSVSLDSIRAAAEAKYGSTDIAIGDEVVKLLNPLRLRKEKRAALMDIQKQLNAADGDEENQLDQLELFTDAIRTVAASSRQADLLLNEIGDDLALMATVFEQYTSDQEAGEASASAD